MIQPEPLRFSLALRFWLKLGFISFGGPAGQIAILHQELVEKRLWISEQRFLHALNFCMLLPGPEAQQLAIYLGWLLHKTRGGLAAGILFVLPSWFILVALSWVYMAFGNVVWIAAVFYAIKPAVMAIVLMAAYRMGRRSLRNRGLACLAGVSLLCSYFWELPFPLLLASAGLIGFLGSRYAPKTFDIGLAHGQPAKSYGAALIDDHASQPDHTRFSWTRQIAVLLTGFLLWAVPMGCLLVQYGWRHGLTQMAWFFSKVTLFTFGGAYAVLPYVYQGAVEHFHWLLPQQMLDGLALGETTPGPLIMIVTFAGFVAGWSQALLGPEQLVWGGVLAALIVTYFTFLPSFVFVFAGGPLIESSRGNLKLSAPLLAISATVVGLIVNLAFFFGWHVFWPQGWDGYFDWVAAIIGSCALLALFKFKLGVIPVIVLSAVAGLLLAAAKSWLPGLGPVF